MSALTSPMPLIWAGIDQGTNDHPPDLLANAQLIQTAPDFAYMLTLPYLARISGIIVDYGTTDSPYSLGALLETCVAYMFAIWIAISSSE